MLYFWIFLKRLIKSGMMQHDGIIFKLKCSGIFGNLLNCFENYLQNRFQRVVLNGKESNWKGFFLMHSCPGTITTHAESINS